MIGYHTPKLLFIRKNKTISIFKIKKYQGELNIYHILNKLRGYLIHKVNILTSPYGTLHSTSFRFVFRSEINLTD